MNHQQKCLRFPSRLVNQWQVPNKTDFFFSARTKLSDDQFAFIGALVGFVCYDSNIFTILFTIGAVVYRVIPLQLCR